MKNMQFLQIVSGSLLAGAGAMLVSQGNVVGALLIAVGVFNAAVGAARH